MNTVYLEITADGLTFRNELGEARLIMVGESVTLENVQGAKIRLELLGDYRAADAAARSSSTGDGVEGSASVKVTPGPAMNELLTKLAEDEEPGAPR